MRNRPRHGFVTTPSGAHVAYAVHGEGPPLVLARGWPTHLDLMWEVDEFRTFWEVVGSRCRVIRFDHRGVGISDREVAPPTLDDLVDDVAAVVDAASAEPVVVWGSLWGGPVAVAYAHRCPERVSHLVLEGASRGRPDFADDAARRRSEGFVAMLRGAPDSALAAASSMDDPEFRTGHDARIARALASYSPEMAEHLYALVGLVDVSDLLAELDVPTLVVHRRDSRVLPVAAARALAATIPGARFVPVPGAAHSAWEGDPVPVLDAVGDLLGVRFDVGVEAATGAPVTFLLTDVVGSTPTTQRLGDEGYQALQDLHDRVVREEVRTHGGREVSHTGDGILSRFASVAGALRAASSIQRHLARHNRGAEEPLRVRVGLATGEPLEVGAGPTGAAVQLTNRVCAAAGAGEVVVAGVVRDLALGKGFTFAARGEAELKGFPDPVRLYALELPAPDPGAGDGGIGGPAPATGGGAAPAPA